MSDSSPLEKYAITRNKGEILFCESEPGETLFFLQEGSVRLVKIIDNKEKNLAIIRPGDIFGEMAILEKQPRSATAIAETLIKLLELNKESFLSLVKSQPSIGIKLLKIFAARIIDQKRKLTIINHSDNKIKVLDTLLLFCEKGNMTVISEQEVSIHVTPEEIAQWAGISEQESQLTLNSLQSNNYLEQDPKSNRILISNLNIIKSLIQRTKPKKHY